MQAAAMLACMALLSGCASGRISAGRANFIEGRYNQALTNLNEAVETPGQDRVLALMERGMVRQAIGDHKGAASDWLAASDLCGELDYLSVSEGTTSLVVNDRVKSFRGVPYERVLLRTFAALSYLSLSAWDDAAVEARNIAPRLERLEGFPDDAFSHCVAGLAFELIDDANSARIEYERAAALPAPVKIGPDGRYGPAPSKKEAELVVLAAMGGISSKAGASRHNERLGPDSHAEILVNGRVLGRTYTLTHTGTLLAKTEERLAAMRAAKTVSRIVIKDALAESIERENKALGQLVRLILFAMEVPDTRRWESLPLLLQYGRFPCPADTREVEIIFRGSGAAAGQRITARPQARRGLLVLYVRDLPATGQQGE